MVKEVENWISLRDRMQLFEKTWHPVEPTKAHLVFIHGFNDRSEIQYYLFPTLASTPYNITCHAIDQRGWGKSVRHPSQCGLTGPTRQVLNDLEDYVHHVLANKIAKPEDTPLFLMGHSMGGQEVLHYLLSTSPSFTARSRLAGAIIEAPYIALDPRSEPSSLLVFAGKVAAMITPKRQMKQNLDAQFITRDPKVNEAWKADELCHDLGTFEGLRDMLRRGADLVTLYSSSSKPTAGLNTRLPVPVLWAHGTADRITAFPPSKALFERLDSPIDSPSVNNGYKKTFKVYEGAYHKIHAEPDGLGQLFSRDVGDWILSTIAARGTGEQPLATIKLGNSESVSNASDSVINHSGGEGAETQIKAKL